MAAAMCVSILVYVLFLHVVARHRDGWVAPLARRGARLAWCRFCGEMEMGKIPPNGHGQHAQVAMAEFFVSQGKKRDR